MAEYTAWTNLQYKDEVFSFFQCENNMPDLKTIQIILDKVQKEKPYCILNIGGGDICADLCDCIVPEITVSTVFSGIATAVGRFQIIGRKVMETDYERLGILGIKQYNIKKALFSFVFKEQKYHYTREEIGLSNDAFVLLVSGWRLSHEVKDAFLQMLENTVCEQDNIEVVFMGLFEKYDQIVSDYIHLYKKAHYFEYEEDALAVTECCDLYINPKRKGGGSSSAEALYKGKPVLTLPFGDVAAAAGEDFWIDDYEKMQDSILRYSKDKEFYKKMSVKAKERAADLTDSKTHFCRVFREIENADDFR